MEPLACQSCGHVVSWPRPGSLRSRHHIKYVRVASRGTNVAGSWLGERLAATNILSIFWLRDSLDLPLDHAFQNRSGARVSMLGEVPGIWGEGSRGNPITSWNSGYVDRLTSFRWRASQLNPCRADFFTKQKNKYAIFR